MKKIISTFLIAAVLLTNACANQQTGQGGLSKADVGTGLGAVGGAVIGSSFGKGNGRIVGTAIGTLLGAGLGRSIGQSMDDTDRLKYEGAAQTALERNRTGSGSTWRNPDSGNYGTITPTRTYEEAGNYCREYNQTITVGGRTERAYGTACRQPDGSWEIVQ